VSINNERAIPNIGPGFLSFWESSFVRSREEIRRGQQARDVITPIAYYVRDFLFGRAKRPQQSMKKPETAKDGITSSPSSFCRPPAPDADTFYFDLGTEKCL